MKFHWRDLPDEIRNLLEHTSPGPAEDNGPTPP